MKKTVLCGLFLGLGIIIGSSLTVALKSHSPRHSFKKNWTSEERAQVKKLFKEDKDSIKPLVQEMEKLGQVVKDQLKDPTVSNEELTASFQKFNKAKEKLTQKRFEMNLKIRDSIGAQKMEHFDVLGPVPFGRPEKGFKGPRPGKGPPPPRGERNDRK